MLLLFLLVLCYWGFILLSVNGMNLVNHVEIYHSTKFISISVNMEEHLIIAVVLLLCQAAGAVTVYKVGVILISEHGAPYDVERSGAAVELAFEEVNNKLLNSSYQLQPIVRTYGPACDAAKAPGKSICFHHNSLATRTGVLDMVTVKRALAKATSLVNRLIKPFSTMAFEVALLLTPLTFI